jgi:hypothetical protein
LSQVHAGEITPGRMDVKGSLGAGLVLLWAGLIKMLDEVVPEEARVTTHEAHYIAH